MELYDKHRLVAENDRWGRVMRELFNGSLLHMYDFQRMTKIVKYPIMKVNVEAITWPCSDLLRPKLMVKIKRVKIKEDKILIYSTLKPRKKRDNAKFIQFEIEDIYFKLPLEFIWTSNFINIK